MKQPVGKRSLQKLPLRDGTVTVGITRKYSVKQYETLDVTVSVTAASEPGEMQGDTTQRLFQQLKKDAVEICTDFFQMTQNSEI